MPILVNAHQLRKAFGARPLFDGLTFSIESGEKIGLIGPNGAGKSTLLRILAGRTAPDAGTLSLQRGLRTGYLEQVPAFRPGDTVQAAVMEGARDPDEWEEIARAHELMSKLELSGGREGISPETPVEKLSGGWKKRVALARELLRQPDLLLLDEPTNHLDVESILWLEEWIEKAPFATLTITHDRAFLQSVSRRILELDPRHPGGLMSVNGDYADYLEQREQRMAAQEAQEIRLKNTLRRETEWLRQGAKARTTKQQARIQRAGELKDTVEELTIRNRQAEVRLDFQGTDKNPKKLIEAKGVSKRYGEREIVPKLDLLVPARGRIGLLGANGCGKSTLIRMLIGTEASDTGEVTRSEHLKVAYFEQNRESLDPSLTVRQTVCPVGEFVDFQGRRTHVKGYLDRFLFSYEQSEMAVGKLSGGEQSRLLLARLMLNEANLLVLDEPTNDLDLATLQVLEDVLTDFPGAVLIVTHDRYFLDQVAKKVLAFDRDDANRPRVTSFEGLRQWEAWREVEERRRAEKASAARTAAMATPVAAILPGAAGKARKLSYKDQREFDQMETTIQRAEARLAELETESAKPENLANASRLAELSREMAAAQAEVDRLYARWAELEG